jgi:hypothetical protein
MTQASDLPIARRIVTFWFGSDTLPPPRASGLESLREHSGVDVVLITEAEIGDWVVRGAPLHPALPYLTPVHRADYFRIYVLHHHGGGYSDIKPTTGSWVSAFNRVEEGRLLGSGYAEIARWAVAGMGCDARRGRLQVSLPCLKYRWLQLNYRRLVGNGAYIFKPGSPFTASVQAEQERRLTTLLPALRANPGRHPKERPGVVYEGQVSRYPVPWSHLLGDVFQPLVLRHSRSIDRSLPAPDWTIPYQ